MKGELTEKEAVEERFAEDAAEDMAADAGATAEELLEADEAVPEPLVRVKALIMNQAEVKTVKIPENRLLS